MADTATESKKLRWFLLQLPLWSLLILLVVTALLLLSIRALLPFSAHFLPLIQQQLNQRLPFEMDAAHVQLGLYRMDPNLVVDQLVLRRQDQVFLQLDHLALEVDSLSSLLLQRPRLQDAQLSGLSLWMIQTERGWQLAGWQEATASPAAAGETGAWTLDEVFYWLEQLLIQGALDFTDIRLHLQPLDRPALVLTADQLTYRRWHSGRQLEFIHQLDQGEASARLLLNLVGETFDRNLSRLDAWLSVPQLNLEQLNSFLPTAWGQIAPDAAEPVSLEAWLQLQQGQVRLEARSPGVALKLQGMDLQLDKPALSLVYAQDRLQLDWQVADLSAQQLVLGAHQGQLRWQPQAGYVLQLHDLSLAPLHQLLLTQPLSPRIADIVQSVAPHGQARYLHWQQQPAQPWILTAALEQLQLDSWKGSPPIKGLDAWVQASAEAGRLIFAQQPLEIGFPGVYLEPLDLQSAQGVVTWEVLPDGVLIEGHQMQAGLLADGSVPAVVSGSFALSLAERDRLYLNLALQPTAVTAHRQLVPPAVLPGSLLAWLDEALVDGQVRQAGLLLEGGLSHGAKLPVQLQIDFDDVTLDYDQGWPSLRGASGWVRVEEHQLEGMLQKGRFLDVQLTDSHFSSVYKAPTRLNLNTRLQGDLATFSTLLHAYEPGQQLPAFLQDWQYTGTGVGQLAVSTLLDQGDTAFQLQLALDDAALVITDADLVLSGISGLLQVSDRDGLAGSQLQGYWQAQPVAVQVTEEQQLQFVTRQPDEALLHWLGWPVQPWLDGWLNIQGQLPLNPLGVLSLQADLQEVTLDLPSVWQLPASRQLLVAVDLRQAEQPLSLQLGHKLSAVTHLAEPQQGLQINLGEAPVSTAVLPEAEGLYLSVQANRLVMEDIKDWIARHYPQVVSLSESQSDAATQIRRLLPDVLREVRVSVNELFWQGYPLGQTRLAFDQLATSQRLDVDMPLLQGQLLLPDQTDAVPSLQLRSLNLPAIDFLSGADAPVAPERNNETLLQLQQLSSLDIQIDRLNLGARSLGRWQGQWRADDQGIHLQEVSATLGETQIQGQLDWVLQEDQTTETRLLLSLAGDNPASAAVALLQLDSPLVSQTHQIDFSLAWPGTPQDFKPSTIQGEMEFSFSEGHLPQIDGTARDVSRFFGVLNLDRLLRRLRLDFSDVTSEGISFDELNGHYRFTDGRMISERPTLMLNSASRVTLSGEVNLVEGTVEQRMGVSLPVGQTLPLAAVLAGAPQIGAIIWVVEKIFSSLFNSYSEATYRVYGPLDQPEVELERVF